MTGVVKFGEGEVGLRLKLANQVVLQLLLAHLLRLRVHRGADDNVVGIPRPPNEVGATPALKGGRVSERGDVLPDLVRIVVVLLELDPLGLSVQGKDSIYCLVKIGVPLVLCHAPILPDGVAAVSLRGPT
jgi:hypothetical protein